jgi:hypothetical protein
VLNGQYGLLPDFSNIQNPSVGPSAVHIAVLTGVVPMPCNASVMQH